MDKFAASLDGVNVIVLNIEGVDSARTFRQPIENAHHGGVANQQQIGPFALSYIPHHVIIDRSGVVVCNYAEFTFDHPALS